MAVYTDLDDATLAQFLAAYDVGELVEARGIAEGISNSNWLVDTRQTDGTAGRFVLTRYERRIDADELPFFLALLDHLAAKGCAVPATIHAADGSSIRLLAGKAAALIDFMPGAWPAAPSPAQAKAVGAALAKIHLAATDFPHHRPDGLDPAANRATLARLGEAGLRTIDPEMGCALAWAAAVTANWPSDLPRSTIHTDLFPDNVLMIGDAVTGLIDFYFACEGMMAYDLAVTHAAWCFDHSGAHFDPAIGSALIEGYETVRVLDAREYAALPLLAQGACLRFTASRAEDWLDDTSDVHVMRKDPMEFMRRWQFYRDGGAAVFANG